MLQTHCIEFHYTNTRCIYPNVCIPVTGITYISGNNGTGKSTLLRILSGLLYPTYGLLYYNGIALDKNTYSLLRKKNTLLLQNAYLFNRTVEENLIYSAHIHKKRYSKQEQIEALESVGLAPSFLKKYPKELSGGEAQRVAIAVRLLYNPERILLDEPTANVDTKGIDTIAKTLYTLSQTKSIVIVAHNAPCLKEIALQHISLP